MGPSAVTGAEEALLLVEALAVCDFPGVPVTLMVTERE